MSDTAVRYLTMLRLDPRYPSTITTSEVAELLEDRDFSVSVKSALYKLSSYFPLFVNEDVPPFQRSLQASATLGVVPAIDLPAKFACGVLRAHLLPILPPVKKQKCPSL